LHVLWAYEDPFAMYPADQPEIECRLCPQWRTN